METIDALEQRRTKKKKLELENREKERELIKQDLKKKRERKKGDKTIRVMCNTKKKYS